MLFLLILISGTSSSFSCAGCPAWRPSLIRDQVLDPWQIRYHFHKKMFLPCQKKGGELFGTKCIFGLFLHKSCTRGNYPAVFLSDFLLWICYEPNTKIKIRKQVGSREGGEVNRTMPEEKHFLWEVIPIHPNHKIIP